MRADAKLLLEKLHQSDFRYREFGDRFAELDAWPVFEALLADPRVLPLVNDPAPAASATPSPAPDPLVTPEAPRYASRPVVVAPVAEPSPFGRYGRPERARNIRSLLQRLSDAVEDGDS